MEELRGPHISGKFPLALWRGLCDNCFSDWRTVGAPPCEEVMCVTLYEKLSLLIAALALAVDITFHLLAMKPQEVKP